MKLGLIGLPGSGKTTLFQCITHGFKQTEGRLSGLTFSISSVAVPDERLDALVGALQPKKRVAAAVEVYDFPALEGGGGSQILAAARETDCLLFVLRHFDEPGYPHPLGSVDPARDRDEIATLLSLADLEVIEKRIEKLTVSVTKPTPEQEEEKRELVVLKGFRERIEGGQDLRDAAIPGDMERRLAGFRFLSRKPVLPVVNLTEETPPLKDEGSPFGLCAKVEAEILELDEEERGLFLEEMGLTDLAGGRVVEEAYRTMDLVTFYTTVSEELRAWTVRAGSSAPQAAGKIHTDMERGFIRAEVAPWADVVAAAKGERPKANLYRLEGKKYVVQDGDVITFRFSV